MFLFGENALATRLPSIILNVLSIIFIYLIVIMLFKNSKEKHKIGLLASLLYAINPITIQSSLVLDMEVLVSFIFLLSCYFYFKLDKKIYLLIPMVMLFWTKFAGAIILVGSFIIFFLINKEWKQLQRFIILTLSSLSLFLVSFFVWCKTLNLNFLMPFKHSSILSSLFFIIQNPVLSVSKSLWALKNFVYFATPFLILLFIFVIYEVIRHKELMDKKMYLFGIIGVISIVFFGITGSGSYNFPKYYIMALPSICIFISSFIAKNKINLKFVDKRFVLTIGITSILIILGFLIFLKDPIMPEISGTSASITLKEAAIKIIPHFMFYLLMPIILSSYLIFKLPKGKKIALTLLYLTLLVSCYINIIQFSADYSTNYMYGDSNLGLSGTIAFLKDNNIPSESIAAYTHIGYYTNFEKFLDIILVYDSNELFQEWVVDNEKIKYVIVYEKDITRIDSSNWAEFELDRKIGDYYIFKKI